MEHLIYKKISLIMSEVGAIEKNRKNTQGSGYMFRGIDDIYQALQPVLAKHGVFFIPEVLDQQREERQSKSGGNLIYTILRVKYTFFAEDGSSVFAITIGEAMDSGDKSANKAMSAALKYATLQIFCIPTEEDNDTENQTHAVLPKKQEPQKPLGMWEDEADRMPPITNQAKEDACSNCGGKMMVSKFNQNELYCVACKTKKQRS